MNSFLEQLASDLRKAYITPNVSRGHDFYHIERMVARGPEIREYLVFEMDEYVAAVWLHNVDRCVPLKQLTAELGGLRKCILSLLEGSDFSPEAKERIIDAVLQHSKKDDEPGDSPLLLALRVADKLDRFIPTLLVEAPASWGHLPIFVAQHPFGYDPTEAGERGTAGHQSIYQTYYRVLEWIPMMPEWARGLIRRDHLRLFITFLRLLGAQAADQFHVTNQVEDDIRHALGPCYEWANVYIA
ncbi:MAG TPA: hypothetical protein VMU07_03045 [Candidatus Paceibacterota bacterium]|nr:hypothetical protein [Candidatus Paceibacterota bacterium]